MEEYLFSVIIPTFNRKNSLESCLNAVSKMDQSNGAFEVIVVDDGGKEDLSSVVREFSDLIPLQVIKQKNKGPAEARNNGALYSKGRYLAFTDDDCCPDKFWLTELYSSFRSCDCVLVGGETLNGVTGNLFSEASQTLIQFLYNYYNPISTKAKFFASNNMAIKKDVFQKINGFDVTTLKATAEDREICDRLTFLGYKLCYQPKAVVNHFHFLTLFSLWSQHFNYGKGAYYYRKVRAIRGQEKLKVEPLSFYGSLISYPVKQNKKFKYGLSCLMIYIQSANVLGFFWEFLIRKASGDRIKSKA